ncbi:MAG: hypothetical protein PHG83_04080 [Patescibacteria group bacterium]|nr:hypothetical protein [Patescibacteria group bacterium]
MHINQKSFINIILIVVAVIAVIFIGIVGYSRVDKKNGIKNHPTNYSTEPFAECVDCRNGETWDNKPCCTDSFLKDCESQNGVVRFRDLHPVFSALRGCYQKAPDTGKECAVGTDCLSGGCDLESAIKSNKCNLIKKELTGGKNQYGNEEFYTATYSCETVKPGICTEAIGNQGNPGGLSHFFKMDNKILIETLGPGFIN